MSTLFPGAIDNFVNPSSADALGAPAPRKHSEQHTDANDAIEAIQARIGTTGSTDPGSIDYRLSAAGGGAADNGLTAKANPVDADVTVFADSGAGFSRRKVTWAAIKSTLAAVFASLSGKSGGQTLMGGTGVSDALTLQGTAANGTSSAKAVRLLVGNAGGTEAVTVLNNGNTGIGVPSPTAALHLEAGGTAAGSAPLKFSTGSLLTVPESGTVEFDGTNYWITPSGLIRRKISSEAYVSSRLLSLVTNGGGYLGDNSNFSGHTFDPLDVYLGFASYRVNVAQGVCLSDELIPVDPSRRYRLSLYAKAGDTGGANFNATNRQYFGLALYDVDGNAIGSEHADKLPATAVDTTLAAPLNPGDLTVTLADATGWMNAGAVSQRQFCWYGWANSRGYVYPDYTYTRHGSHTYSSNNALGTWNAGAIAGNIITLRVPWAGPALPMGAAVRNVTSGVVYKYIAALSAIVPNAWTRYEGIIEGVQVGGISVVEKFRVATAYCRFVHLVNYHGAADNNVRLSCVSLSDLSSANLEAQIGIGLAYKSLLPSALPANGLAVEGRIGSGTAAPSAQMHAVSTGEQLRLGYDAVTYAAFQVDSLGRLKIASPVIWRPAASATPPANGDLAFEATSNTTLTVRLKGSDGVVRSATLSLT